MAQKGQKFSQLEEILIELERIEGMRWHNPPSIIEAIKALRLKNTPHIGDVIIDDPLVNAAPKTKIYTPGIKGKKHD